MIFLTSYILTKKFWAYKFRVPGKRTHYLCHRQYLKKTRFLDSARPPKVDPPLAENDRLFIILSFII